MFMLALAHGQGRDDVDGDMLPQVVMVLVGPATSAEFLIAKRSAYPCKHVCKQACWSHNTQCEYGMVMVMPSSMMPFP